MIDHGVAPALAKSEIQKDASEFLPLFTNSNIEWLLT
jgi:hypothetical protein